MPKGNSHTSPFPKNPRRNMEKGKVGQEKGGKNLAGSGKSAGSASPEKIPYSK